jgi:hypothetical protein
MSLVSILYSLILDYALQWCSMMMLFKELKQDDEFECGTVIAQTQTGYCNTGYRGPALQALPESRYLAHTYTEAMLIGGCAAR